MRAFWRAGVAGCGAIAWFVVFLVAWTFVLDDRPAFERSRAFEIIFAATFVISIVVELVLVRRFRNRLSYARFLHQYAGSAFVVGTTRKQWHALFTALFAEQDSKSFVCVWWRQRAESPLRALDLARPPADLPFAVQVTASNVNYVPLGASLRSVRGRRPISQNATLARQIISDRIGPAG